MDTPKVVLVTGAGRRIGAAIAQVLHAAGWNVVLHANQSYDEVCTLAEALNAQRPASAHADRADLLDPMAIEALVREAYGCWQRLDALVNNASTFFQTPLGTIKPEQFDELIGSNLKAPLLLTQACVSRMDASGGAVVNLLDVHARKPQRGYAAYTAAKAGLWALTEALALELAPRVRVNGVAPGHMLWPEAEAALSARQQHAELARIPLGRLGGAEAIAEAVRFLLSDEAAYLTGAVLPVDGGLRLA
ncbi:MAG TPA: pteridine reductase [Solimonas sp.]